MKFAEEQLREFAKPLSEHEEEQCKNAIRMVADSLKKLGLKEIDSINKKYLDIPSYQLRMSGGDNYEVTIFLQGSYANNTNVRKNSDVDIAVVQEDTFRPKYRYGVSKEDYGFVTASPRARTFKDEVENALRIKFGDDVVRRNKSIKINGNSYRKDADSVPCLRYRDYSNDYSYQAENYVGGILIKPDKGDEIINYPEQHMTNGIKKNKETNYYFKKMVRVGKEMRYRMQDNNYCYATKASSFGVECLLWNVPNKIFMEYDSFYIFKFNKIINYLYDNRHLVSTFKEVNNIKSITEDGADREQIYRGFIEELKGFYHYEL